MSSYLPQVCVQSNANAARGICKPPCRLVQVEMASSYGSVPIANISTGVKAKLQKWMGKASTNVRDKRSASCQENAAEITDYALQLQINNAMPVTYHSRTHSAPIPMTYIEKAAKKPRKSSISTPPSSFTKNPGTRENGKIDEYPKNGMPRGLTHSMVLHESSSGPSSSLQKQNNVNCCSKVLNLEDQTDSVAINSTRRTKNMESNANAASSRALMKGNRPPCAVSRTSGEYSDESTSSDNEKITSNLVFESNQNDVQQLSGQIQSRLQKWVERASYQAALQDRRLSEESASSTDDSLNAPESPKSRSSGSEPKSWTNESQVKKIKELELALKELVENVGIRGGTGLRSSGSSAQRSRNNSQKDNEELDENGNQGLLNKLSRDCSESGFHQDRNSSSSTESDASVNIADGDAKLMIDNPEKSNELSSENQMEDLDDAIFKSTCPIRDPESRKYVHLHTNGRRSVTLQEVLLCETLIEQCPIQNNKVDQVKKITQTNGKRIQYDSMKNKDKANKGEYSLEAKIIKNRSGKSELAERQNDTDNSELSENSQQNRPRDGPGKKLERPKLRKQITDPNGSSLKVVSDLAVRESMRQYLKFKDADLSAFAVECVRHANKKKQGRRRERDVEKENLGNKTVQRSKKANTDEANGAQSVQIAEINPGIVIISSQDEDDKTDEAERSTTPTDSCRSSMDDETANKPVENERRSRYSFARTAEEAEWFTKEFIDAAQGNRVAKKESLERSSSNPQRDPLSSQRLYKFPSMPMFYIPKDNVDSENEKQEKKETVNAPSASLSPQRRSVASFPSALVSLDTRPDPFYHGLSDSASTAKQPANSNSVLTGKEPSQDENGNEVDKTSKRPKLRKRKMSAPSRSGLYPMTNVRVDIEALI